MMRRDGHTTRSRTRRVHRAFDKTTHNLCPRCKSHDLAVYFNSGSPRKVGALCYSCGLVGFFARNDFFEIGKLVSDLAFTIGNHVVCKQ
jgi:hypothetical protein